MMVMVANHTSMPIGYLAGRYPGRIGHLYSPGAQRGPYSYMPYALDNGAFAAFTRKEPFDVVAWRKLLRWATLTVPAPLWALVPDVVADRDGTLRAWETYAGDVMAAGMRPAFAAQDGMTPADVPSEAAVVFLGGSTTWKLASLRTWGAAFPGRLHVGRVNTLRRLMLCYNAGAVSVDGTGWKYDAAIRLLAHFLARTTSKEVCQ